MVEIKSERAQKLLQNPRAIVSNDLSLMKKYPSDEFSLWVHIELENQNVKNLSFAGNLEDYEKVILEATASLMKDKSLSFFENLTLRECEAFLRDRNSELAVLNLTTADESKFHKFFQWLRVVRPQAAPQDYHFSLNKGHFRDLKLVDKVRELKAFLNSVEIQDLYAGLALPELVDVDDLTVYIQVPYHSEKDRALFEGLHVLGVAMFQEETLNFIPEA